MSQQKQQLKLRLSNGQYVSFPFEEISNQSVETFLHSQRLTNLIRGLVTSEQPILAINGKIIPSDCILSSLSSSSGDICGVLKFPRQSTMFVNGPLCVRSKASKAGSPSKKDIAKATAHFKDTLPSNSAVPPSASTMESILSQMFGIAAPSNASSPANSATPVQIDQNAIEYLKEMGFSEKWAKTALKRVGGEDVQLALEWLLENMDDHTSSSDDSSDDNHTDDDLDSSDDFVPDPESVSKLAEMGFSLTAIHHALKISNNNFQQATAHLLGDQTSNESNTDANSAEANQIMQAILSNHQIAQSLQNPRVRAAAEAIMENPSSAVQYLNDPEIGPMIMQCMAMIMQGGGSDDDDD